MIDRPRDFHYQVPRRFGIRTILVVVALFAAMLSIVKWTEASPRLLIFYSSFVIVVAVAQVVLERSPRLASILAGVAFLSVLKLATFVIGDGIDAIDVGPFMELFSEGKVIFMLVFGALFGYLSGTLLAGLYLVLDKIQFIAHWRFRNGRMPTEAS